MSWQESLTELSGPAMGRAIFWRFLTDEVDRTKFQLAMNTPDEPTVKLGPTRRFSRKHLSFGVGLILLGGLGWMLRGTGQPSLLDKKSRLELAQLAGSLQPEKILKACTSNPKEAYLTCFSPELTKLIKTANLPVRLWPGLLESGAAVISVEAAQAKASGRLLFDFKLLHLDLVLMAELKSRPASEKELQLLAGLAREILERMKAELSELPAGTSKEYFASQIAVYSGEFQNKWSAFAPAGANEKKQASQELGGP